MSALGECKKCQGPLCLSGRQVVCDRCGLGHAEHPVSQAWAREEVRRKAEREAAPAAEGRPWDVGPVDYAADLPARVKALGLKVAALEGRQAQAEEAAAMAAREEVASYAGRLETLEARMASLEQGLDAVALVKGMLSQAATQALDELAARITALEAGAAAAAEGGEAAGGEAQHQGNRHGKRKG